jgi:hypothetical protein
MMVSATAFIRQKNRIIWIRALDRKNKEQIRLNVIASNVPRKVRPGSSETDSRDPSNKSLNALLKT